MAKGTNAGWREYRGLIWALLAFLVAAAYSLVRLRHVSPSRPWAQTLDDLVELGRGNYQLPDPVDLNLVLAGFSLTATASLLALLAGRKLGTLFTWLRHRFFTFNHYVVVGDGTKAQQFADHLKKWGRVLPAADGRHESLRRVGVGNAKALIVVQAASAASLRTAEDALERDRRRRRPIRRVWRASTYRLALLRWWLLRGPHRDRARPQPAEPLRVHIILDDSGLALALRAWEMETKERDHALFASTLDELAARGLMRADRPEPIDLAGLADGGVLVVGATSFGQAVIVELAKRLAENPAGRPVPLTLIDRRAHRRAGELADRFPLVARVFELRPRSQALAHVLEELAQPPELSFFCSTDEQEAVAGALLYQARWRGDQRTVVRLGGAGALGHATSVPVDNIGTGAVVPALAAEQLQYEELLIMRLPRRQHERHLKRTAAPGATEMSKAWHQLGREGRESNVKSVDAMIKGLVGQGCSIAPLNHLAEPVELDAATELRNVPEHERWLAERLGNKWRYGPERNDKRRVHPGLLPWAELPPALRDGNRNFVRSSIEELFDLMEQDGLHIVWATPQRTPRVVLGSEEIEGFARAIHATYLRSIGGPVVGGDPAARPWEDLAEELRESNREVARDITKKMEIIGAGISSTAKERGFVLTPDEIEFLARAEHQRWVAAKLKDHWSYGLHKDAAAKTNPALVPWPRLPLEDKDKNRDQIVSIPVIVHDAGLFLTRDITHGEPPDPAAAPR